MAFEIYRQTHFGDCLVEALSELVEEEKIPQELAVAVLKQFDSSILDALENHTTSRATMKADMKTYKYYDNVWQFSLHNVDFKLSGNGSGPHQSVNLTCDRVRVVLIDEKLAQQ